MSVDNKFKISFSSDVVKQILDRKLSYFDSEHNYNLNDILEIQDVSNNENSCKILIIDKKKTKNDLFNEKTRYFFLIYSTKEEERLLNKRLKALGYLSTNFIIEKL